VVRFASGAAGDEKGLSERESESTHLMFRQLFEATGIEQPPVQATLAFSASPAHLTVMPAPHLGTSGTHRDQSTEALNETADQDKETTPEPDQQDQMKSNNTNMVSQSIEASPLLCNDSAAVDPREFAYRIADESPKQTNDQRTEDTPKKTVDPIEQEEPEQEPSQSTTTVSRTSDTSCSGDASTSSHTGLIPSNGFRYFLELSFFLYH